MYLRKNYLKFYPSSWKHHHSLDHNVVVVVLGKAQNLLNVNTPFKQINRINCIRKLKTGPEYLLFIPNTVEFDRYTLPTYVPARWFLHNWNSSQPNQNIFDCKENIFLWNLYQIWFKSQNWWRGQRLCGCNSRKDGRVHKHSSYSEWHRLSRWKKQLLSCRGASWKRQMQRLW